MKKQRLLMVVMMALLAIGAGWAQTGQGVKIGDVQVTTNSDISSVGAITSPEGSVAYDAATRTLTLTDAMIDPSGNGLELTDGVTVVLNGTNTINVSTNGYSAIIANGQCTISGDGSLSCYTTGAGWGDECAGIYLKSGSTLTFKDCGVYVDGMDGYGISGPYDTSTATLVVDHAGLTASGSTGSICNLKALTLKNGSGITSPIGAAFDAGQRGVAMLSAYGTMEVVKSAVTISVTESEPYAVLHSSGQLLEFFYDGSSSARHGTVYKLGDGYLTTVGGQTCTLWAGSHNNTSITSVRIDESFDACRLKDCSHLFRGLSAVTAIEGLEYLHTDEATTLDGMFSNCQALTSLDLSGFNTAKATSMSEMFSNCRSLTSLDLSSFSTALVTRMDGMLSYCTQLTSLDLSAFTTASATTMLGMFQNSDKLVTLDLRNFTTAQDANVSYMFRGCTQLQTIYCNNTWTTTYSDNGNGIFQGCQSLRNSIGGTGYDAANVGIGAANPESGYFTYNYAEPGAEPYALLDDEGTLTFYYDTQRSARSGTTYMLPAPGADPEWRNNTTITAADFDASFASYSGLTSLRYFFYGLSSLQEVRHLERLLTASVTSMSQMFYGCSALTVLDLSSFSTARVTAMSGMFEHCSLLATISVGSGWNVNGVTESASMFSGCTKLVGSMDTSYSSANATDKTYARVDGGTASPGYLSKGAEAYGVLYSGTLTIYYDTQKDSRTGTKYSMSWPSGGKPGWYDGSASLLTAVVVDASMASYHGLRNLSSMFHGKSQLASISGLQYLNTENVVNMRFMFSGCHLLTSIDLSHLSTASVTDMMDMFSSCSGLTQLDVTGFDTRRVTNMNSMFSSCSGLELLNLKDFDMKKVSDVGSMFRDCTSLMRIMHNGTWTMSGTGVFTGCTKLRGAVAYEEGSTDADRANPDTGYFTAVRTQPYVAFNRAGDEFGEHYLTFFYDDLMFLRPGLLLDDYYSFPQPGEAPAWTPGGGCTQQYLRVKFDASFRQYTGVTSTSQWFKGMTYLWRVYLQNLDTYAVTDMSSMFEGCTSLEDVFGLSDLNVAKVASMDDMFRGCTALRKINMLNFNPVGVESIAGMFTDCTNLTTIICKHNWSNSKIWGQWMFQNCPELQGTTVSYASNGDSDERCCAVNANPFTGYFVGSSVQPYAVLSADGTTLTFKYDEWFNVVYTDGTQIFRLPWTTQFPGWTSVVGNTTITAVVFDPSFDGYRDLTSTSHMFAELHALKTITNPQYLHTEQVADMSSMFYGCSSFYHLNMVSLLNTSKVTDMSCMFDKCTNLTRLDLSNFDMRKVSNIFCMFQDCSNLQMIICGSDLSETKSTHVFKGCEKLRSIWMSYDAEKVDASYATPNGGYFTSSDPIAYARIDDSGDGKQLVFHYDNRVSSWVSQPVFPISDAAGAQWLGEAENITSVVFNEEFAAYRPKDTSSWFRGMKALATVTGIEWLNTQEVTDMSDMFAGCQSLATLDVSHFTTSRVTCMRNMFKDCGRLNELDLFSFDMGEVSDVSSMFQNCGSLALIYSNDNWLRNGLTSAKMFAGCSKLKDKAHGSYDAQTVDATYANPTTGYFTAKPVEAYALLSADGTTLTFCYDDKRASRSGTTYDFAWTTYPGWTGSNGNGTITTVDFDFSFARYKATRTANMFYKLTKLATISHIERLNTSHVTDMSAMFAYCYSLTSLDLSHFDVATATDMSEMFLWCSALETAYCETDWSTLAGADVSSAGMFFGCISLTGAVEYQNIASDELDISWANPQHGYFTGNSEPEVYAVLDGTALTLYYDSKRMIRQGTSFLLDMAAEAPAWTTAEIARNIATVTIDESMKACHALTSTKHMFSGLTGLMEISGIEHLNTENVTDMSFMFYNCCRLKTLDLSLFSIGRVADFTGMFSGCCGLTTIYSASDWSDAPVSQSASMFYGCTSLQGAIAYQADDSQQDVSYANPLSGYFSVVPPDAEAYAVIDGTTLTFYYDRKRATRHGAIYGFSERDGARRPKWAGKSTVTKAVFDDSFDGYEDLTDASYLFYGLSALSSIEGLGLLHTGSVSDMSYMFAGIAAETLDLSSLDLSSLENASHMFDGSTRLATVVSLQDWDASILSEGMFFGCQQLEGGRGTRWDATHTDGTYARRDQGPAEPGYFTDAASRIKKGDVDGNGQVTMTDVATLISIITDEDAPCGNYARRAGNMDDDPALDIADVRLVVAKILRGYCAEDDEVFYVMKEKLGKCSAVLDWVNSLSDYYELPTDVVQGAASLQQEVDELGAAIEAIATIEERNQCNRQLNDLCERVSTFGMSLSERQLPPNMTHAREAAQSMVDNAAAQLGKVRDEMARKFDTAEATQRADEIESDLQQLSDDIAAIASTDDYQRFIEQLAAIGNRISSLAVDIDSLPDTTWREKLQGEADRLATTLKTASDQIALRYDPGNNAADEAESIGDAIAALRQAIDAALTKTAFEECMSRRDAISERIRELFAYVSTLAGV